MISGSHDLYNNFPIPFITFTLQLPIVVALFFLNFFSDAKPKYIDLEEQVENLTPETGASFPSKMFFSWFDGLAWRGWRRTLTEDDLWALTPENRYYYRVDD